VLECYHVTGENDFLLKIAVNNIQEYEKFILEKFTRIKGVNKINTSFILSTFKYKTKLKLD
jgi:DNA-binding Lrp family transcriptional regulator